MKVLFIQARQKSQDRFLVHPPYGLLYLGSILRLNNINVKIYDANIRQPKKSEEQYNEVSQIIDAWKPDIIGIGGMISSFKFAKEISYHIKKRYPHVPLIAGGLLISASPELVMKHTALDFGCIGEAEEIIVGLLEGIYKNEPLDDIEGLIIKKPNSELLFTAGRGVSQGRRKRKIKDIDWMPLPAYDMIDLKEYLPHQAFCYDLLKGHFKRFGLNVKKLSKVSRYAMPLFAGRGCPFNCEFCFSTMDKMPVKHSVDYVIKHLEYLESNYGLNHFQFLDENFNYHREWVIEFCKKIIAKHNDYYFTTCNRNMVGFFDKEMLDLMRQANFYEVSIGVESLDDAMLKVMNRATTSLQIMETLKLIKESKIERECLRCLFGFPGDSKESIFSSIKKGNSLGYLTLFSLVIPMPGTPLHEYCLKKGIIKDALAYLYEIHDTDGYRNLTSFKSLEDVARLLDRANLYSQASFALKNNYYIAYLKSAIVYALKINKDYLLSK